MEGCANHVADRTQPQEARLTGAPRVKALDVSRGVAVVAMVAFHFIWDLGNFGWIDSAIPYSRGVKIFGHCIAFAFLFIAGASLALAHDGGRNWPRFWRRLALIVGAAALVSAGTYVVFPDAFVFFGILHCIAAASLVAAPFLLAPWPAALIGAAAAAIAPTLLANAAFNTTALSWIGLSTIEPLTNDYRPLLPYTGALLLGVTATKFMRREIPPSPAGGERRQDAASDDGAATRALTFLGRHSLLIYLAHQPLLFAGFMALATIVAPPGRDSGFLAACEAECLAQGAGDATCHAGCLCTQTQADSGALTEAHNDDERAARLRAIAQKCMSDASAKP